MAFELISWIYISLLCTVWGKGFVVFFFRNRLDVAEFDFPVLCFIGMWAIGIVAISFSLFMPLTGWIKMLLQVPVLFYFLSSSNRQSFFKQLGRSFIKPSVSDLALLVLSILMILFISSSAIIHPDTLNYHIYSIRVFDLYGMVPGIANLRPDLGFQSLWFTVMSVFDLSLFQPQTSYPLSGCVMSWFIIFLISKITAARTHLSGQGETAFSSAWYL
ncbi:MAG TPA: hypothetical protein VFC34_02295, partial [Puia sp.]|nr:hypothetical protein [Puia sp.]